MKYLFMVVFLLIAPAAMASPELPPLDWMTLLVMLGGEHGKVIGGWIAVGLVIWSQVRQLIPPSWLAKLPDWLITIIEWLAANKGTASNDLVNDPRHIKRVKR